MNDITTGSNPGCNTVRMLNVQLSDLLTLNTERVPRRSWLGCTCPSSSVFGAFKLTALSSLLPASAPPTSLSCSPPLGSRAADISTTTITRSILLWSTCCLSLCLGTNTNHKSRMTHVSSTWYLVWHCSNNLTYTWLLITATRVSAAPARRRMWPNAPAAAALRLPPASLRLRQALCMISINSPLYYCTVFCSCACCVYTAPMPVRSF